MDDLSHLHPVTRKRTSRVQGPRPCSWTSPSSSSGDNQDLWSWTNRRADLARGSTLRSNSSSESSYSTATSFSSPSAEYTPNITLTEYGAQSKPHSRHSHRRKPAGPRPAHNILHSIKRPALVINTALPIDIPVHLRFQEELPEAVFAERAQTHPLPWIPPLADSPTNFLLDWDAIFEVLGCSRTDTGGTEGW
ncbi:hypothetical protein BS17DRAFT_67053 [Gyrodon lividus]|nr:hypothetical protein BS17DRAFT_67053 [Gyrodon lividus]